MGILSEKLKKINTLPMHMPGHKRKRGCFFHLDEISSYMDITEIEGFDNLHNPSGILKDSMEKAADLKGARMARYLVNGSTGGILASVLSHVEKGDKVICARNCHKSVYNALALAEAECVFIMGEEEVQTGGYGSISPYKVEETLSQNTDARLLIITSPTYEGIISDIYKISEIAHRYNVPLLVDAAHGAHLGYSLYFDEGAVKKGADISVESLHKTLPSLTQSAILYLNGNYADEGKIIEKLSVFQTSSPSYLLMASIDGCIDFIREEKEAFKAWSEAIDYFYEITKLKNISFLKKGEGIFDLDKSKIVLTDCDGNKVANLLRKEGIEPEMSSLNHVVLMTGIGDRKEEMEILSRALIKIDAMEKRPEIKPLYPSLPKKALSIKEAEKMETEYIDYKDAQGKISADYIFAYPPGIPIIIPGEIISDKVVSTLLAYEEKRISLSNLRGENKGKILVVKS